MFDEAGTGIARPEPTHHGTRCGIATLDVNDDGEATELRQIGFDSLVAAPLDRAIPEIKSIGRHAADRHPAVDKLERFWRRHVSVAVPHASCRDHLGTFYGADGGGCTAQCPNTEPLPRR